jgi:hypothetical protein
MIKQIRDILHGSHRWDAGLQWYDFLIAIEFQRDGTGQMMQGEGQVLLLWPERGGEKVK